jgi:hypothetical protein
MSLLEIAKEIHEAKENIILTYAFNSTGKTMLSRAYKDLTKNDDGTHAGVYFNAYSEDIFAWDNDDNNDNANMRLVVRPSSLSKYHSLINEENLREKLKPYKPHYDFRFVIDESGEEGQIDAVSFYEEDGEIPIKISRGEERIFIWCFFLALFEVEGWADVQSSHFFIDDPVASLDDHNLFITAFTILNLIEQQFRDRKIIITTHHAGLFSILFDSLLKGEKSSKFKKNTKALMLSKKGGDLSLEGHTNDVFLYHLRLLQILKQVEDDESVKSYHFVLLRQVLENVASFLGTGRIGHVLEEIGMEDVGHDSQIINTLSHKNIYFYESDELVPDNRALFSEVLQKLMNKYGFVLHAE